MINLLVTEKQVDKKLMKPRRMVMTVTSGILVAYLVSVGGFGGWTWYVTSKQNRINKEAEKLLTQVKAEAQTEALIRKLAARAELVEKAVRERGSAGEAGKFLVDTGNKVQYWNYSPAAQAAGIIGESAEDLSLQTGKLTDKYLRVGLKSAMWQKDKGWTGEINYEGLKANDTAE